MTASSPTRLDSLGQARALVLRLRTRQSQIEQAALIRVFAIAGPAETGDPQYAAGLRAAVSAAIEYGFAAVEQGEERAPPLPAVLLTQARLAARNNVSLDTVLRRYFAGYSLFGDFLMQEVETDDLLGASALKRLLRNQAIFFDHLVAAVAEEYNRESESYSLDSSEERRAKRIEKLIAAEPLDTTALQYDFDAHHIGAIAVGNGADHAIGTIAKALGHRLLLIRREEEVVWAWLGSHREDDLDRLERHVSASWPSNVTLVIGELGHGLAGWRLTHRQARAALPVALRLGQAFTRYADVALLASITQDNTLSISLRELYLAPLSTERDGGVALRETLRAYFVAERNSSSAAASLGVSRQTVNRHLRIVEQRLGRSLGDCAVEIETALRLERLEDPLRSDADRLGS